MIRSTQFSAPQQGATANSAQAEEEAFYQKLINVIGVVAVALGLMTMVWVYDQVDFTFRTIVFVHCFAGFMATAWLRTKRWARVFLIALCLFFFLVSMIKLYGETIPQKFQLNQRPADRTVVF